jgi:TRAP-type C4-dicarboxylate transport system permease small subunit
MSKKLLSLAVVLGLISILVLPVMANAQDFLATGLESFEACTELPTSNLQATVANILNAALGLLGLVAVVIILIGGFKWMTAMGNEENVKKARQLIIQGVIGLIIIVLAFSIAQFVLNAITSATD